MNKELLKNLIENKKTYSEMVDFCTDNLILNNEIMPSLELQGFEFECYCGEYYDYDNDNYIEVYQYYIIDSLAAERFAEFTNEIVVYCRELELYLLCVTHYGTSWDYMPSDWIEIEG